IPDDIVSPTFVLVNEYHAGRIPLYHFDLYRLEPSQVGALMIEQYWDESEYEPGIVAIEWAERLGDRPPNALRIHLQIPPVSQERESSNVNGTADEVMNPTSEYRTATVSFEGHSSNAVESVLRNLMLGILSNFEQSRRIC
ncbi:MAG: tRNA (adenosine(37)-N6)-threonylcarbamoyltransferase complex ATPase subunit type 1 TsaE, partial [Leptolyngbyaceae bacterium]|nr:tRNA (adenosine(37)-N6)-threonylcarbamoyltransferase complex ATPase subunit type 1 TsaE [Leptolyngbyaceae bacterium]